MQLKDEERLELETMRKKAEINVMKIMHDLKNPILAINELVDNGDQDINEFQEHTNQKVSRRISIDSIDTDISKSNICYKCRKTLKILNCEIQFETSDMLEMLENLKISFKIGHDMEIGEEKENVTTYEIVQSISKTHTKLANNGVNE